MTWAARDPDAVPTARTGAGDGRVGRHPTVAAAVRGFAVLALALCVLLRPAAAQQPADEPPRALTRADELYFSGRPLEALEVIERQLRRRPGDYGALWRASRAAVAHGLIREAVEEQNEWYRRGADYGRRAVEARPSDRLEGHYWLAANAGLHAIQAPSPGTIVELGEEVRDAAEFVLARDPDHAGAHNVLGQLHFEIMKLSTVERWLGRLLLGSDAIAEASWEGAERHLERAAELSPSMIRYRLDLARLHLRRDRPEPAVEHLRAALRLEPVHPPDSAFQQRARRLLERARGELADPETAGSRGSSLRGPPSRPAG